MSRLVYVLNGPNLNLLGKRQPHIYGRETLADVEALCRETAAGFGLTVDFRQSNAEHVLIDAIHDFRVGLAGIVTAAIGGVIADKMSDDVSNILFATLLTIVAIRLLWQLYRSRSAAAAPAK